MLFPLLFPSKAHSSLEDSGQPAGKAPLGCTPRPAPPQTLMARPWLPQGSSPSGHIPLAMRQAASQTAIPREGRCLRGPPRGRVDRYLGKWHLATFPQGPVLAIARPSTCVIGCSSHSTCTSGSRARDRAGA